MLSFQLKCYMIHKNDKVELQDNISFCFCGRKIYERVFYRGLRPRAGPKGRRCKKYYSNNRKNNISQSDKQKNKILIFCILDFPPYFA